MTAPVDPFQFTADADTRLILFAADKDAPGEMQIEALTDGRFVLLSPINNAWQLHNANPQTGAILPIAEALPASATVTMGPLPNGDLLLVQAYNEGHYMLVEYKVASTLAERRSTEPILLLTNEPEKGPSSILPIERQNNKSILSVEQYDTDENPHPFQFQIPDDHSPATIAPQTLPVRCGEVTWKDFNEKHFVHFPESPSIDHGTWCLHNRWTRFQSTPKGIFWRTEFATSEEDALAETTQHWHFQPTESEVSKIHALARGEHTYVITAHRYRAASERLVLRNLSGGSPPKALLTLKAFVRLDDCAASASHIGCALYLETFNPSVRHQAAILFTRFPDQPPGSTDTAASIPAPAPMLSEPLMHRSPDTVGRFSNSDDALWALSMVSAYYTYCETTTNDEHASICETLDAPTNIQWLDLPPNSQPLRDLSAFPTLKTLAVMIDGVRVQLSRDAKGDWQITSAKREIFYWDNDHNLVWSLPEELTTNLGTALEAYCKPDIYGRSQTCGYVYRHVWIDSMTHYEEESGPDYDHELSEKNPKKADAKYKAESKKFNQKQLSPYLVSISISAPTLTAGSYEDYLHKRPFTLERPGLFRIHFTPNPATDAWIVTKVEDLSLKENDKHVKALKASIDRFCGPKPPGYNPEEGLRNDERHLLQEGDALRYCDEVFWQKGLEINTGISSLWINAPSFRLYASYGWCADFVLTFKREANALTLENIVQTDGCNGA